MTTMTSASAVARASATARSCPSCSSPDVKLFYRVEAAPVHSVLLMRTEQEALDIPKRDIELGLCRNCGFISNTVFDPSVHNYSPDYEETQGFSPTFRAFHDNLARTMVERYGITGKTVIEIGCGKGEFLSLLCRTGGNRGIGIDPAFVAERNPALDCDIEFIADFYSEKFAHYKADAIVCKMTLEHIHDTHSFVSLVRKSIGDRVETLVFFQVPDADRILEETAFQDIYYEHCSYFTGASLAQLFTSCGFDVVNVEREYAGQYLTIAARPSANPAANAAQTGPGRAALESQVDNFAFRTATRINLWRQRVHNMVSSGMRVALWGSGSKGVAFLTALQADADITCVVDINPYRQGMYMAGSGHRIVSPESFAHEGVQAVIAMNSIYVPEIQRTLDELGVKVLLLSL
jgi:hypothetical protein